MSTPVDETSSSASLFPLPPTPNAHDSSSSTSSTPTRLQSPASSSPSSQASLVESLRALREATSPSASRLSIRSSPTFDGRSSRRAPAPSPLQRSAISTPSIASPTSPRNNSSNNTPIKSYTFSPRPSPSNHDEPRSPREKLDALLATESAGYGDESQKDDDDNNAARLLRSPQGNLTKAASYSQLRSNSGAAQVGGSASSSTTVVPLAQGSSPPASPPTSTSSTMKPTRPEPRPVIARNASLDSAASSISSTTSSQKPNNSSHGHKSSQDIMAQAPPDFAALIASAGSPEAALHNLWKEKQSSSAHNAQLWRLVEKQRAMILGLNKDLEKSLKEKERYRRKMKESLAASQVPPVPAVQDKMKEASLDRATSQSPASELAERSTSAMESVVSDVSSVQAPTHDNQPKSAPAPDAVKAASTPPIQPSDSVSVTASKTPSPTELKQQAQSSAPAISQPPASDNLIVRTNSTALRHSDDERSPPLSAIPQGLVLKKSNSPPSGKPPAPPAIGLTQPTPNLGQDEFPSPQAPSPTSHRKAPPAPLDLSKPSQVSSHLHQPKVSHADASDSDYSDILEMDEIPEFERGRKKTREEDDRQREILLKLEERSKSAKKSKSAASSAAPSAGVKSPENRSIKSVSPPMGLPASPRHAPAGISSSLNAMLSPTGSDRSGGTGSIRSNVVSPPLMSPGLPASPRPGDRPLGSPTPRANQAMRSPLASPPMSNGGGPLSPRAPKGPIPMPPQTPLSSASVHLQRAEQYSQQQQQQQEKEQQQEEDSESDPESQQDQSQAPPPQPRAAPGGLMIPGTDAANHTAPAPPGVFRGLVSDQYPNLLLPPNAIPSIDVRVFSSRMRPSRHSLLVQTEEDPVFLLGVYARSSGKQLWQVEKNLVQLPTFDQAVKGLCNNFQTKLPDRNLFSGHAPAKIDARRTALNNYIHSVLNTEMNEKAALIVCEFFSTDVIEAKEDETVTPTEGPNASTKPKTLPRKEGYLTKRGKNFGGWKARFFVLNGPEFRYYEAEGGSHLGTIRLFNAQIGKQSQHNNQSPARPNDDDNQYRHAFLILEPKRKDSSTLVRHVLCAESDEERDSWVSSLLQYVDYKEEKEKDPPGSARSGFFAKGDREPKSRHKDTHENVAASEALQGVSYENTVQAEAPTRGERIPGSPITGSYHSHHGSSGSHHQPHHPAISGPTNGNIIHDAGMWGNKNSNLAAPTTTKDKKRSIFGFTKRTGSDPHQTTMAPIPPNNQTISKHPQKKEVFGLPLVEAVECSAPIGVDTYLPSVVYRCLAYMHEYKAHLEEGIFRLSGSNIVIKQLRERFNTQGDVNLIDGEYYDVHAVASLLKLYLRELPNSLLTRNLHLEFLKVLELDTRDDKIAALNVLAHKLPRVNFELIEALSAYLVEIVDNSQKNKMTVRNVGIVFAPTLNIPAPLISFFVTDHLAIFGSPIDEASSPIMDDEPGIDPSDAIRSPRKQMFSDLPTPSYAPNQPGHHSYAPQHHPGNPAGRRPPSQFPMASAGGQRDRSRETHTGFIPMQPSYESVPDRSYDAQPPQRPAASHLAQQGAYQRTTSYETDLTRGYEPQVQQPIQAKPQNLAQQGYQQPQPLSYETVTTRGYDPNLVKQAQLQQAQPPQGAKAAFASLNSALRPGSSERSVKAKRRESSMMVMNGGGAFPMMGQGPAPGNRKSTAPRGLTGLHE